MSLFAGNVSHRATPEEVRSFFSKFGPCRVDVKRGYAFIDYDDDRDAEDARNDTNGRDFHGIKLNVEWSKKHIARTAAAAGAPPPEWDRGRRSRYDDRRSRYDERDYRRRHDPVYDRDRYERDRDYDRRHPSDRDRDDPPRYDRGRYDRDRWDRDRDRDRYDRDDDRYDRASAPHRDRSRDKRRYDDDDTRPRDADKPRDSDERDRREDTKMDDRPRDDKPPQFENGRPADHPRIDAPPEDRPRDRDEPQRHDDREDDRRRPREDGEDQDGDLDHKRRKTDEPGYDRNADSARGEENGDRTQEIPPTLEHPSSRQNGTDETEGKDASASDRVARDEHDNEGANRDEVGPSADGPAPPTAAENGKGASA